MYERMSALMQSGWLSEARERLRHAGWFCRKFFQVFSRTDMSHILAVILALLVLLREAPEFAAKLGWDLPRVSIWLILVVTLVTVGTAVWELVSNRMKISRQEVLFLYGARALSNQLQQLLYAEDDQRRPSDRLSEFLDGALNIISATFSVHAKSDAGLMVRVGNKRSLKLVKSSKDAEYPSDLTIPIPPKPTETGPGTGPAGVAYAELKTVYVPRKRREVWPFDRQYEDEREWYRPIGPVVCWVPAEKENFWSVLCVPIATYRNQKQAQRFGVLNLSTGAHDPYVDRDFMMAECFAQILAIAFAWARVNTRGNL